VGLAIKYATALKCGRINCLAGIPPVTVPDEKKWETLVSNVRFAAEETQKAGVMLVIEALNSVDMPGFCLSTTKQVLALLKAADHPNAYVQYDIYHMQIMEGNLTKTIGQNIERIGHIQLADVPGRHEPGTGEINFDHVFRFIDGLSYDGWIGCEYNPSKTTEESLHWLKDYM